MAEPLYISRFRVVANSMSISGTIDGVAQGPGYIAAGTYYLDSPTGAESFRQALEDALEATFTAPNEDFTCAWSTTTGKMSITCDTLAGVWSLTFNQLLADVIGWGSTLGFGAVAGPTQTSPEVCSHCIFAGSGRSEWPGLDSDIPNADGSSSSGVTSGVGSTNEIWTGSWVHEFERYVAVASPLESGTRDDASAVRPWTWQDFFRHHRTFRHPFRLYAEAGSAIASYEEELVLAGKSLGKFGPRPREVGSWYQWVVPLEVQRYKAP